QNVAQARRLADRVLRENELELMAPVPLNIVCLRYRPDGVSGAAVDELNLAVLQRLHQRGVAVPSATTLAGGFALRVCITNHRTRQDDVDVFVDAVLAEG